MNQPKSPILPADIANLSAETLIRRNSKTSRGIYAILLCSIVCMAVAAFFLKVDVNIRCAGIITTAEKTVNIVIPVYAKVSNLFIVENQFVKKGDTLLILDETYLAEQAKLLTDKIEMINVFVEDLTKITSDKTLSTKDIDISSDRYRQTVRKYKSDINTQKANTDIHRKEYLREKELFSKKASTKANFEQVQYAYNNTLLQLEQTRQNQLSAWHTELSNYKTELLSLHQSLIDITKEIEKHTIIATCEGYVQNLSNIECGSSVYSGQTVASITPHSKLIVELYLPTKDIGLIYLRQKARFRIDAFDANVWGFADGFVTDIANDVTIHANGEIVGFKLHCDMLSDTLKYKNNAVCVKKGMTCNANFILCRRTIAQLLFDKVSDWFNPNI